MTTPNSGDTVSIDYVLKRGDGQEVGNTAQSGPQEITLGSGQIFPQIEQALAGMKVGDSETVAIASDNAFGPRRGELVMDLPRDQLPAEPAPQPGMVLNVQTPDGKQLAFVILKVEEETVKADGNHPLAGEDLTFELTLRDIKQVA